MGGRSAKLAVVVLKACMLEWGVHLPVHHAKFGVVVLKACMLDWWGDLPGHLPSLV